MSDIVHFLGQTGAALALGLGVIGSALGIGAAGQAASGGWAREGKEGRNLSFTYVILCGLPLSQTIYGFVLLLLMKDAIAQESLTMTQAGQIAAIGLAGGLAQLFSAWMQGKVCAAGIRALVENGGKGFANIIIAAGVVETVGIFGMVFTMLLLPNAEQLKAAADAAATALGG